MTTTPIDNTSITTDFNVDELTEGTLTGKGVFDVLLQTLRLHLDREFNSNRITGTAYATVYSQAITAFLTQAAQYAISKAKLPLELQLLQEQINLTQKQQNQITAAIRQTDYVTDYQLPSEVANKTKQTEILAYELTNIKPVELGIAQQDLALKTAQADLVEYDLTTLKPQELALLQQQVAVQLYTVQTRMPAEVANIQAETALKAYDLTDIKPTEKAQITQQTSNLISQKEQTVAETSRVLYEVNYRLPEEVTLIKHNQDQVVAQTDKVVMDTTVASKQGSLIDAQTSQITAETTLKLPEDVELIKRNQLSVSAQTSLLSFDLQNTKPVEVANLIKQGNVLENQSLSIEAETDKTIYQTTYVLPQEVSNLTQTGLNITKQGSLLDSQKVVSDKQALSTEAETAKVTYETTYILPENKKVVQYSQDRILAETNKIANETVVTIKQGKLTDAQTASTSAQTALYAQKKVTELAQTTTTPASGSVMGVQNDLMATQKASYLRDAEQKAAKMLIDTWSIRHNAEPGGNPVTVDNRLRNEDIGDAVGKMLTGIGVV